MIIEPGDLAASAVVPQCIDNQFVPREAFELLLQDSDTNYDDKRVKERRTAVFQEEFIRALLYSSQVVINRAALPNNELLYRNYLPDQDEKIESFAKLLRKTDKDLYQAVVPYLFKEKSFVDRMTFGQSPEGSEAAKLLFDKLENDEVSCVRLSADDNDNQDATDHLAQDFATYFGKLGRFEYAQLNNITSELFETEELREQLGNDQAWNTFVDHLDQLTGWARGYNEGRQGLLDHQRRNGGTAVPVPPPLARELLYARLLLDTKDADRLEEFILSGETEPPDDVKVIKKKIAMGSFRAFSPEECKMDFPFSIKKLIDLRYNSNLADKLDRYTITPLNFPSRSALQDEFESGFSLDELSNSIDALRAARRSFVEGHHKAAYFPHLAELTIADVIHIRQCQAWNDFIKVQEQILSNPLQGLEQLDELHERFATLQLEIAKVFSKHPQPTESKSQFEVFVNVIVSVGGFEISRRLLGDWEYAETVSAALAASPLPDHIKGIAVKIIYNVWDKTIGKGCRRRSWLVEVARSKEVLKRSDFLDLVKRIQENYCGPPSNHEGRLAEIGKSK